MLWASHWSSVSEEGLNFMGLIYTGWSKSPCAPFCGLEVTRRGRADKIVFVDNLHTYASWNVSCVGFSNFQYIAAPLWHRCRDIVQSSCTSDVMTCCLVGLNQCASGAAVHPGKSYFQIYVIFWWQNQKALGSTKAVPFEMVINQLHLQASQHISQQWRTKGAVWGTQPPTPKFWRPSKIVPNSARLWKLLKITESRTPTPHVVRKKKVSKIVKLPRFAIVLH